MSTASVMTAAALIILIFIWVGWRNRLEYHARVPDDAGLVAVIILFALIAVFFNRIEVSICALSGIMAYALGNLVGPSERTITVWTRNTGKNLNRLHKISYFLDKETAYIAPSSRAESFAAFFGARSKLDIDLSRPYYTTKLEIEEESIENIIPVALSSVSEETIRHCISFGHRKVANPEDPSGPKIKEKRYLLHFKQRTYTYVPADRMYQRPDVIFFDLSVADKAIADASTARARVSRLELELSHAKYDGVIDHVRDMCSLDMDHHNLPEDLRKIIDEEEKRRLKIKDAEDVAEDGGEGVEPRPKKAN